MTYDDFQNLKVGARIKVFVDGEYHKTTLIKAFRNCDSAIWISYDEKPRYQDKDVKMYTGAYADSESWNKRILKNGQVIQKFILLTEEELNDELMVMMGSC